ncbi:MAG: hypothetical protein LQ344_005763 [Seirophora lacunosa]|nr:MAG: hypothetical protein LQ344_005763 [Seirophora lacunosa]
MFNSDVWFREHAVDPPPVDAVTTARSSARSLLFGNSEVLIRSDARKCELAMAMFLNSERHSLWSRDRAGEPPQARSDEASHMSSDAEVERLRGVEERLRARVESGDLMGVMAAVDFEALYRENNLTKDGISEVKGRNVLNWAASTDTLSVPGGSTQELRAVLRLSSFPHQLDEMADPNKLTAPTQASHATAASSRSDVDALPLQSQSRTMPETPEARDTSIPNVLPAEDEQNPKEEPLHVRSLKVAMIRQRLGQKASELSLKSQNAQQKRGISDFANQHLALGQAFLRDGLMDYAGQHLLMACLIAEHAVEEDYYNWRHAQLQYAKYLDPCGWYSSAQRIMEQVILVLQVTRKTQKIAFLLRKIQLRLASTHIKQENFQEAEKMYHEVYHQLLSGSQSSGSIGARCLEREAWAQVRQGKYREARVSYWKLLELANIPRQTVLCNLGFIETRLGNLEQAKSRFNDALSLPMRTPGDEIEHYYTKTFQYRMATVIME